MTDDEKRRRALARALKGMDFGKATLADSQTSSEPKQNFIEKFNILPILGGLLGLPFGGPVGGAVGSGIGEAVEQKLTGKSNVRGIAAEAAFGGLGGMLGRFLGLGGRAASKGGLESIGAGLQKFATGVTPGSLGKGSKVLGGALKEADVLKTVQNLTKAGSATAKRDALEPLVSKLGNRIAEVVPKKAINVDEVLNPILKQLEGFAADPAYEKPVGVALGKLSNIVSKNKVDPQVLLKTLSQFGDDGFKTGGSRAVKEVNQAVWKGLRESVANTSEEVADLITQQGHLFAAAEGPLLQGAKSSLRLPFLGINVPGMGAVQTGADVLGRGLQTGAEIAGQVPAGRAISQIAPRLPFLPQEATGGEVFPEATPEDLMQLPSQAGQTGQVTGEQVPSSFDQSISQGVNITPDMVSLAHILLEPKEASKIEDAYKSQSLGQAKPGASDEFLSKANDTMNSIASNDKLGFGPAQGRLYEFQVGVLGGAGLPNKVIGLNQKYTILKLNVLRAYQGARISDKDFELANLYIPKLSDTDPVARTKLQVLKQLLNNAQPPQTSMPGMEPTAQTDLMQMLGGQ